MPFGETLKRARLKKEITLRKLGERAGCSWATLSEVENGALGMPDDDGLLKKIAQALDLDASLIKKEIEADRLECWLQSLFGHLLRKNRESSGKTLKDLAEYMGWSISYLSDIERGRRNPPDASGIIKIANGLNCPPEELLEQADRHRKRIELHLTDEDSISNQAALMLARKWAELSEQQLNKIVAVVLKG